MKHLTTHELAVLANTDSRAADILLERMRPSVARVAGTLSCPGYDAADLVQEGLLAILGSLPRFSDPAKAPVKSAEDYLAVAARNEIYSICQRKRQRLELVSLDGLHADTPAMHRAGLSLEDRSLDRLTAERITQIALEVASTREWLAAVFFSDGMTAAEVAAQIGGTEWGARKALYRLREKMRLRIASIELE